MRNSRSSLKLQQDVATSKGVRRQRSKESNRSGATSPRFHRGKRGHGFEAFLGAQLDGLQDRVLTEYKGEISALEAEVEILQKRLTSGFQIDTPPDNPFAPVTSDAALSAITLATEKPCEPPANWQSEGSSIQQAAADALTSVADNLNLWAMEGPASSHSKSIEKKRRDSDFFATEIVSCGPVTPEDAETHDESNGQEKAAQDLDDVKGPKFKLSPAWEERNGVNGYRTSLAIRKTASMAADNDSIMSPDGDDDSRGRLAKRRSANRTTMSFGSDANSEASSVAGDIIPLLRRFTQRLGFPVQLPSSKKNVFWKIGGLFLLLFDVAVVPMEIFKLPDNWFLETAMWIIRCYWLLDMAMCFTTGYFKSQGSIELRFFKVAKHYLQTWFLFDFACILCDWLVLLSEPRDHDGWRGLRVWRMIALLRTVRLLRLAKAPEIEGYVSEHIRNEKLRLVASIAKIIAVLLCIAHLIACAWYGLGVHIRDKGGKSWVLQYDFGDKGIGERYAVSIHWSLAQFMGENIISLDDVSERTFAILALLFAFVSSAIFVSSITTLMTKLQLIASKQSSDFAVLRRYLLQNAISTSLSVRVIRNAHHHYSKNSLHATEENVDLLKKISTSLQMEVRFEVYYPIMEKHPFFQNYFEVNPVGVRKVCHRALTTTHYFHSDVVFSQDETPENPKMYFTLSGHLSYSMDGIAVARMMKGTWACEPVLWTSWIHLGSLQAQTESSLLNLEAKTFQSIVVPFPSPHAYSYGVLFLKHCNSGKGLLTDLGGVDLEECLSGAFAELEDSENIGDPSGVQNAWGARLSSASNARRTSLLFGAFGGTSNGRRMSGSSASGRRGSFSNYSGSNRNSIGINHLISPQHPDGNAPKGKEAFWR